MKRDRKEVLFSKAFLHVTLLNSTIFRQSHGSNIIQCKFRIKLQLITLSSYDRIDPPYLLSGKCLLDLDEKEEKKRKNSCPTFDDTVDSVRKLI